MTKTYTLAVPVHPGELIRDAVIPDYGLSIADIAARLRVARPGFNNFLNGRSGLSTDLAFKLEAAFGVKASVLLSMMATWELWSAERRRSEVVDGIQRLQAREYA